MWDSARTESDVIPSGDALEMLAEWVRSGNERYATIERDDELEAWKVTLHSRAGSRWGESSYLTVAIREVVLLATEGNL